MDSLEPTLLLVPLLAVLAPLLARGLRGERSVPAAPVEDDPA